jgi:hypothetical protein
VLTADAGALESSPLPVVGLLPVAVTAAFPGLAVGESLVPVAAVAGARGDPGLVPVAAGAGASEVPDLLSVAGLVPVAAVAGVAGVPDLAVGVVPVADVAGAPALDLVPSCSVLLAPLAEFGVALG